jgi:hypothetical protein
MANTAYIFIRNTGAVSYRVQWKLVTEPRFNGAQFAVIPAQVGDWTTAEIDISPNSDSSDYDFLITPICVSSQGNDFPITVWGICRAVDFTAEWNNCLCPEITGITTE